MMKQFVYLFDNPRRAVINDDWYGWVEFTRRKYNIEYIGLVVT